MHARTLHVVEGGLIGLVRRNGHAHGLHWVKSRQAIRVTLRKNRSKASDYKIELSAIAGSEEPRVTS